MNRKKFIFWHCVMYVPLLVLSFVVAFYSITGQPQPQWILFALIPVVLCFLLGILYRPRS